jgi:citrate synthase
MIYSILLGADIEDKDCALINELLCAHYGASHANNNMSKLAFVNSFVGSGNPYMATIGALSTLGNTHGPVVEARETIYEYKNRIEDIIFTGGKVPGYGGAFFKDRIDPAFIPVVDIIQSTEKYKILQDGADLINRSKGRKAVYPNPAGITACVAELLGLPKYMETWFFLVGRSAQWFLTINAL